LLKNKKDYADVYCVTLTEKGEGRIKATERERNEN